MVSRINAFIAAVLLLSACSGSGEADEAPGYEPEAQAGSGSMSSAGTGSQQQTAGAAGSAGSDQGGTGGTAQEPAPVSDECNFRGPYRLVSVLISGPASCTDGAEMDAALQGRDVDACTGTFCVAGTHCMTLECDRGNPVPGCSATLDNGGECVYAWEMVPG